jgi:hypothetical protein
LSSLKQSGIYRNYFYTIDINSINLLIYFYGRSEHFDTDVADVYNFEKSVEQYSSVGGTAKSSVLQQINHFKPKYN